jgi:hypothetical protein
MTTESTEQSTSSVMSKAAKRYLLRRLPNESHGW